MTVLLEALSQNKNTIIDCGGEFASEIDGTIASTLREVSSCTEPLRVLGCCRERQSERERERLAVSLSTQSCVCKFFLFLSCRPLMSIV